MTKTHETVLAHDMHGNPLHYVKSISVPRGQTRQGWKYSYGYRDFDGRPWDVLTRLVAA